jgi:hypothetical protein
MDEDVSGLDYDILVLSDCPDAAEWRPGLRNNMNRMLLSTKAGLEKAGREYVLKLRSDMRVASAKFLEHFDAYPARDPKYSIFKRRLLCDIMFTIKFEEEVEGQRHHRPFHVSDWWYFGLAEDIKALFDVPLAQEPGFSQYFATHKKPEGKAEVWLDALWKMSPEQYIFSELAKKHFPKLRFDHMLDYDDKNILLSERLLVNNYLPLQPWNSGISLMQKKYRYRKMTEGCTGNGLLYPAVWLGDYKKHCDPDFRIPFRHRWKKALGIEAECKTFAKHSKMFVSGAWAVIIQPFILIAYAFKIAARATAQIVQETLSGRK